MDTIGERIKRVRKDRKLTQEEFAIALGTKRGNISKYEIDENSPSDAIVSLLKDRFSVNEVWLRTGEGEPYIERSREKRIEDFFRDVEMGDNEFKKAFIEGLAKLTAEEWVTIEKICKKMAEGNLSAVNSKPDTAPDDLDSKSTEELEAIYKNETLPMLSEKARTVSGTSGDESKAE